MTVFNGNLSLKTNNRFEIVDITQNVNEIIANSDLNYGISNIFSKHSTSAIIINENESGLLKDMET
ncbi:MAG: YjbQ family protein, partial [Methanobrevibacter sp.]|nr:YjbQ family protein [Methanobrevibacter sp.]